MSQDNEIAKATKKLSQNGKQLKIISEYSPEITAVSSGRNFTKNNIILNMLTDKISQVF